jgi:cyclopropane-fatty-acyl-phospholipid synthase
LIVPLPRLVPPAAQALRWAALRRLRSQWAGGRLDLTLPSGETVQLGGHGRTEARAHIHDDRMFLRMLARGELGAGEAYVAGEWSTATSDDLVDVLRIFLRGTSARGVESSLTRIGQLASRVRHRRAANTHAGSSRNVHAHYDLGNAFYRLWLDAETLTYSCGIWPREYAEPSSQASSMLAAAQHAKHERLCDWLALTARDHLLEIGCGWGGMAIHAARTRGCRVTAITVSREQLELARTRVAAAGLADRIAVELRDYRDVTGRFDKIVSIEMLEQVGYEYLPRFFTMATRLLRPGGRLALQTITMPDERFDAYRAQVDWMQTYVFPGTLIPSLGAIERAITTAAAPLSLVRTDDIGPDYAPTLRAWRERFMAALPQVRALGFDTPFVRTWLLYLAFSEAAFAERTLGDHQMLYVRS